MWNNCTQYESNESDKIQNESARIVTGATRLASIDSLHTEIGWETLGSRRKTHMLTMFYKMKNGLCPDYLASLVSATVGSASTYPLRNSSALLILHTNSRLYSTSFLPSAVRDWNELPEQTRNSPSLESRGGFRGGVLWVLQHPHAESIVKKILTYLFPSQLTIGTFLRVL